MTDTTEKTWQQKVMDRAIEISANGVPEEGDFNTAMIQLRDEIPEKEMALLQKELEAVETGTSVQYAVEDDGLDDWDDPAWCYKCNRDTAFCECPCSCGSDEPRYDCCG